MKLWSFQFADLSFAYYAARVAAPDKTTAREVLAKFLNCSLSDVHNDKTICQYMGQMDVPEPTPVKLFGRTK